MDNVKFVLHNPFTMMVAGPTQSGKTTFVSRMLQHSPIFYSHIPNKIFYFYNIYKPTNRFLRKHVHQWFNSLPTMEMLEEIYKKHGSNNTVVIDDQALHITPDTAEMFSVGCSRFSTNIVFITQNLFGQQKANRDLSKNCMYVVLMRNTRECSSIRSFFLQQPENYKSLQNIYASACHKPYSYLFCDLHQKN